jgi:hypothetical protein
LWNADLPALDVSIDLASAQQDREAVLAELQIGHI